MAELARTRAQPSAFDRLFDEWTKALPFRRSALLDEEWAGGGLIRVDELHRNGDLVIRAEMPGLDPEKDVEVTVDNGMLRISAEHREEERSEAEGYVRRELRRGSFSRTLPLPDGVAEDDIVADYKDGILEITVPTGEAAPVKKVSVTRR